MALSLQSESVTIAGSSYYNIKPDESYYCLKVHEIAVSNNSTALNLASLYICDGSTIIHKDTLNYNGCFNLTNPLLCNSTGVYYRVTNNTTRTLTAIIACERQSNNTCALL